MKKIKKGTTFIVTSNDVIHCLDNNTKSCLSKLTKKYPIMSLKEANEYILNNPFARKCEHCLAFEDLEIEY